MSAGKVKPAGAQGAHRNGGSTRGVSDKNRESPRWDNEPGGAGMKSLARSKVKDFVRRAGLAWDGLSGALHNLDLLRNGKPVNAALAFFAKKPVVKLRCAVFAATTTATILEQRDYEGGIRELIERGQDYILENIGTRGGGAPGLPELPELEVAALREALVNAFCHRDYHDPDEVRIAVFQDRVEIRNPGKLPGGLTLKRLREGSVSARRNPLIADLLRRIRMFDGWGRGMALILEKEPKARFQEVAHLFIASFPRPSFDPPGKEREPAAGGLLEAEKHILAAIRHNRKITLKELAEGLGMTKDGVRYHTDNLKNKAVLRRIGTYNGHWEIV